MDLDLRHGSVAGHVAQKKWRENGLNGKPVLVRETVASTTSYYFSFNIYSNELGAGPPHCGGALFHSVDHCKVFFYKYKAEVLIADTKLFL